MNTPRDTLDRLMDLLVAHKIGPRKYDLPNHEVKGIRMARAMIRAQAMRIIELEDEIAALRKRRRA